LHPGQSPPRTRTSRGLLGLCISGGWRRDSWRAASLLSPRHDATHRHFERSRPTLFPSRLLLQTCRPPEREISLFFLSARHSLLVTSPAPKKKNCHPDRSGGTSPRCPTLQDSSPPASKSPNTGPPKSKPSNPAPTPPGPNSATTSPSPSTSLCLPLSVPLRRACGRVATLLL